MSRPGRLRFEYDAPATLEIVADGKRQTGHSRNISLGGMFVDAAEVLAVQTTIQVRFYVPTQPEPIDVTGEVRWAGRPLTL